MEWKKELKMDNTINDGISIVHFSFPFKSIFNFHSYSN